MGYKDITEGDKIATPKVARFIKSKKGTLGIEVRFNFVEPSTGTPEYLNWTSWLSEGAIEYTMETLVSVLGYNGSEATDADGVLTDPNALNWKQEVKLVVAMEEFEGKSSPRIKYVNKVGGSGFAGVEPESVKSDLAAVDFKAHFLAIKKNGPKKHGIVADEEIPF
jgi:hypothetical protein